MDARGGPVREQFADFDALRLVFTQPEGFELLLSHPSRKEPEAQLWRDGSPAPGSKPSAAADKLLEIAVPFQSLGRKTDQPVHFYVELLKDEQPVERVPHEGVIETVVPSPDYELIMWQV